MTKLSKEVAPHGPEEDGTFVSSSARTFSRLIKKEKVRECMRHLRSLVNPVEGVEKVSTIATLENALKALKEANSRQASGTRGKKQSQSSGGGTQPSNALNTTSNTQSKSSSEGEEILSFSSLPYTEAKVYSLQMSLSEGEVINAEKELLQVLNYPLDSWRGCLLTNFVFDPDIPRLLTCLYHFTQNRKQLKETGSSATGNKKQEQFCLRFRVNPSLSRGTFAAPSSDRYLPFLVKASYQYIPVVATAPSRAPTDQNSGRTYIACVSSGVGSETSYTTTARMTTEGAVDDNTSITVAEQLTLSIARIEHFYTEPYYVPKRNRFATQLTIRCHLTNVDPILTSLIGFLPQDLEHVSIFDLVHTSDLSKIYDAYKEVSERLNGCTGERWTHVPPVRWRCCSGTDLLIQTNIRYHMEKSSDSVDCIYGLHEIMRGPEKLTRFFDPTVSNHFSRLWLSHQKHSQGNMNTTTNSSNKNSSMNTDQAGQMQGQPEDETTTTMDGLNFGGGVSGHSGNGDVTAASISWMVDPRRLRLKALFQDLSQTELAHATSLGISLTDLSNGSDSGSVQDKKINSKDSVDLDNDSAAVQLSKSKNDQQRRQQRTQRQQKTDEENSLNVTLAARGFSYDAWNHYHQIQRYLMSVQRETRRLQIRNQGISHAEVLLPESSIPGLPVVGRSLGSSAVVQMSDNDAQAIATDGELLHSNLPKLQSDLKDKGDGSESAKEQDKDSSSKRMKMYTNALPLTVDNLQRHTRIQEKHYRQQMLHQLKAQVMPVRYPLHQMSSKTKWFDSQQQQEMEDNSQITPSLPKPIHQQQSAVANASTASASLTPQQQRMSSFQQQDVHSYRYRIRQPIGGNPEKKRSEAGSASQKKDMRALKRKIPVSITRSSSSASSGSSESSSHDSNNWHMTRVGMVGTSSADGVIPAPHSNPRRHSEDNRRRCKFRKMNVETSQPPPLQREPQTTQNSTAAQQPQAMFYGGPHASDPTALGMPPVHFAECYPSRKRLHSSRRMGTRRGVSRHENNAYSGDHLDLYANATHPVPFYVTGTPAPPPPPHPAQAPTSRNGGRESSTRRAHRPIAGVVPGAVPAAPFAGLWGLPSWGFVPLMPWHSYPGAPVQWPYYPQVGGALPPYLHGGFFGNPQQQQQPQSQQSQQPSQKPPQQSQSQQAKEQQSGQSQRQTQSKSQMEHRMSGGPEPGVSERRTRRRKSPDMNWEENLPKKCTVPPLYLASPQPSVIVTAHTEEQASEMLSSVAEGGSEGASSSFVYLLDTSSHPSQSSRPIDRQQPQEQSQTAKEADKSKGLADDDRVRNRPIPRRGRPFWLSEVGEDYTEETEMQYQISCPADCVSSSSISSNSSFDQHNTSDSRPQRLWRRMSDKAATSGECMDVTMNSQDWRILRLGAQVIELLQYDDASHNDYHMGRSSSTERDNGDGRRPYESHYDRDGQEHTSRNRRNTRHRSKSSRHYNLLRRDRSQLNTSRIASVSSGRDSAYAGRGGSYSPWGSSIKESDGVTASDEGSGLSGVAESHLEMEPFLDCLFVGSTVIPTMGSSATGSFELRPSRPVAGSAPIPVERVREESKQRLEENLPVVNANEVSIDVSEPQTLEGETKSLKVVETLVTEKELSPRPNTVEGDGITSKDNGQVSKPSQSEKGASTDSSTDGLDNVD